MEGQTLNRCAQCSTTFSPMHGIKENEQWFCSVSCKGQYYPKDDGGSFKSTLMKPTDDVKCGKCGTFTDYNHSKTCQECGDYLYQYKTTAKQAAMLSPGIDSLLIARVAGCIGAALLVLGAFSPLVSLPFGATVTYVNNGQGDGMIILALAALSLILSFTSAIGMLMLTSLIAGGVMGFTFYNFQTRMAEATAQMRADLAGNPFAGLAEASVQAVQLQWGWGLLIIGAIVLFSAGLIGRNTASA